ncbi:DHA2 family efflux MFS transporter permease subunit [Actinobacteria bacterium YIM 96077]|uniref:MFS transporter n=1 Tax=Phytoactinopolyspora halophila TaxID=1981511 RepID=A0A329QI10_9ACTN|nr:DHA2 family efflux MFS transporter permease subunit [Actinobacteria bacterium YIM 96077]RAW12057.1 MFS transporter [Phytoactinopolyspora halophila]
MQDRPSAADSPDEEFQPRRAWLALSALCLGFFMILLVTTIVNIAIPRMLVALQTNLENMIWVNSVYLLALAVPLLVTGRLGDRYGPKRVFLTGLALFTASSFACGLATSVEPLIAARAGQGLGAAAMMPQTMAFVYHLFPPGRRGVAMGAWGGTAGVATVSGPLLGGLLVDSLGWQWIFYVNVPVGLVAIAMTVRLVPDWQPRHSRRFDPLGIALFTVGLAAVIFGLQEGERFEWGSVAGPITVWWLLGGGLVLLVAFVMWQRRTHREPLLPLRLFEFRSYSLSILANWTLGFALIGAVLPLMLYLQTVRGYPALLAGLIAAPMAFASGVMSVFIGRIAERVDGRMLGAAGFTGYSAGLALLAWVIRADSSPWTLVLPLTLAGLGMGAIFAPLATLGTLSLPPPLVGSGSGLFNTLRQVGGVVGSAAVGVLLQARLATEVRREAIARAGELPVEYREQFVDQISGGVTRAGGAADAAARLEFDLPESAPADIAEHARAAAEAAFVHGFTDAVRSAILMPAIVLIGGVFACLTMPRPVKVRRRAGGKR